MVKNEVKVMDEKEHDDPNEHKEDIEFLKIFEEMNNLAQFVLDNADKEIPGILPKNLDEQLKKLEQDVDEFCRVNEALLENYKRPVFDPPMKQRQQEIYDRSKKLLVKVEDKLITVKGFLTDFVNKKGHIEGNLSSEERKKQ